MKFHGFSTAFPRENPSYFHRFSTVFSTGSAADQLNELVDIGFLVFDRLDIDLNF